MKKRLRKSYSNTKTRKRGRRQRGGGIPDIKSEDLAFVSCFYGDDKNVSYMVPPLPSEKHNCYFLTNNPKLLEKVKGTKWIGMLDNKNKPITDNDYLSSMYSKEVKAAPHHFHFLNQYKYIVYLDSKLPKISIKSIYELIDKYLVKGNYAFLIRKHQLAKDNFIWTELNGSMEQERYKLHEKRYRDYVDTQIKSGFKDIVTDHAQTGFIIRNMNHPRIKELDEFWYSEIKRIGIQCQIVFFFVRQRYSDIIKVFTEYPFEETEQNIPRFNPSVGNISVPVFSVGGINIADIVKKMIESQLKNK